MPADAKLTLPSGDAGAASGEGVSRQASPKELERPAETPSAAEKRTPSVEEIPRGRGNEVSRA